MVVDKKMLIYSGVGVAVAAAIVMMLHVSEEDRVKKQFSRVSRLVSMDEAEHVLVSAKKGSDLGELFADSCILSTPVYGLSGTYAGAEIGAYSMQIRPQFSDISLKFYDYEIDVVSETDAVATLTMTLRGSMKRGERLDETRELECRLRKFEDEWLFTEWLVVEVLRR